MNKPTTTRSIRGLIIILAAAWLSVIWGGMVGVAETQEELSFLHKGDLWVCIGDSITCNDT